MAPILQERIKWRLYLIHAFFCAVSFVVVYFTYPETCGVRLEDMDSLFGDATTTAGTPTTVGTPSLRPEEDPLVPAGSPDASRSNVRGRHYLTPFGAVSGLYIEPPVVDGAADGKVPTAAEGTGGGIRGWFSRAIGRVRAPGGSGGRYAPLDQGDD